MEFIAERIRAIMEPDKIYRTFGSNLVVFYLNQQLHSAMLIDDRGEASAVAKLWPKSYPLGVAYVHYANGDCWVWDKSGGKVA